MMRILIVEDDMSSLVYLQRALASKGYEVDSATNGLMALKKAHESIPDLIISDILMPEMDGFELCKRVKLDEKLKKIPFVFYTATYIDKKDEDLAMSLGASKFLIKPMEPYKFLQTIEEILEKHKSSQLPTYDGVMDDITTLKGRQIEALTRKLTKKIEELQREREALIISEYKYRRLYESMMDGFVFVDMDGYIKDCNRVYLDITGYSKEELYRIHYNYLTPQKWHDFEDMILKGQILKRGYSDVYEKEYIRKNGDIIPVELRTFLVKDINGNNEGMWAIVRDISEKKRIESENKKLQEQLIQAQKLEAIGLLAGGVAHEFNNILHAIIGYASLIDIKMDSKNPLKKHLKDLINCADKGSSIVNQILSFSRKQTLDMKPIDLNEKIKDIEVLITRLLAKNISVEYELTDKKLIIIADKTRIDQIFINLVINARDAMPNGGTIKIKTEHICIDEDNNETLVGEYALVTIKDTGCGIDEETLNRIFEPFFTTKPVGQGTGLGLSVIYGIIKQHNGFIKVESQKGIGTTFFIYLPIAKDGPIPITKQSKNKDISGNETILIAEDDESVSGFLEEFLKYFHYNIILVKNGQEAVQRFMKDKDSIDLCLFDQKMPVMDGLEAANQIKMIKPLCKIILINGHTISHDKAIPEDILIISKPIEPRELIKTIRSMLNTQREVR